MVYIPEGKGVLFFNLPRGANSGVKVIEKIGLVFAFTVTVYYAI
jgi:hypothetical protein